MVKFIVMQNVFDHIASAIKETKAHIVLIGGFAVNYYGVSRHTADVDFLTSEKDYALIFNFLKKFQYSELVRNRLFARVSSTTAEFDLDFLFTKTDTLNGIFKAGRKVKIANHSFTVPSLLHLIALKVHSWKQEPGTREYRDFSDIVELVRRNKLHVKTKKFQDIFLKYGTKEFYDKVVKASNTK